MGNHRKVSDLKPNPHNPRGITDEQLSMLEKSIKQFGDLGGIVFNRRTQQLVGGHQRIKTFQKGEWDVVIDHEYDEATIVGTVALGYVLNLQTGERFSYREVEWDLDKEKAANIAANKHGGFFDLPKLREWVMDLDHKNVDLELTGFTHDELDKLMAPVFEKRGDMEPEKTEDKLQILECPCCGETFERKQARVVGP